MLTPPDHPGEAERLRSLRSLNVLDTPAEDRFDRITRLARRMFDVPIVAISLVDESRQWFKSVIGLAARQTSRDISFCGHAILQAGTLVVEDAACDQRFADNPLVTEDPGIRFYAGHPLSGPDGQRLGTLCIIDREPRRLSDQDRLALQDLATLAETELTAARLSRSQQELIARLAQAERQALLDSLTGLWNRAGILQVLQRELLEGSREAHPVSVIMADIDHFKAINDEHGHGRGDEVLREVAARLRGAVRPADGTGRIGGEEFALVLPGCGEPAALQLAERVRVSVAGAPIETGGALDGLAVPVTLSLGVTTVPPSDDPLPPASALERADSALYEAKAAGRNRVCVLDLPAAKNQP